MYQLNLTKRVKKGVALRWREGVERFEVWWVHEGSRLSDVWEEEGI